MPYATIDDIRTRYEVTGSTGPALLMYSPGGFDARLENWSSFSVYARLGFMDALPKSYTCVTFDRRESGLSGGRVERIAWADYVTQGVGLLDHLGIDEAFLMGGCVGCSSVLALANAHPDRSLGMVLFSPAGGPRYRMAQHARFADHAAFVRTHGLAAVVDLAHAHDLPFTKDPRVGPWVTVIRTQDGFAEEYVKLEANTYLAAVTGTARVLYDRDTVPGVEPEDLMRLNVSALIVPGQDASHAPSAARYLQECLPDAEYWDTPVADQTSANAPQRILDFLNTQSR
ncbi:MAG: alpha/beta fold hydrolase [Actinocrinis sp.]